MIYDAYSNWKNLRLDKIVQLLITAETKTPGYGIKGEKEHNGTNTQKHQNETLYTHWSDDEKKTPEKNEEKKPIILLSWIF